MLQKCVDADKISVSKILHLQISYLIDNSSSKDINKLETKKNSRERKGIFLDELLFCRFIPEVQRRANLETVRTTIQQKCTCSTHFAFRKNSETKITFTLCQMPKIADRWPNGRRNRGVYDPCLYLCQIHCHCNCSASL